MRKVKLTELLYMKAHTRHKMAFVSEGERGKRRKDKFELVRSEPRDEK